MMRRSTIPLVLLLCGVATATFAAQITLNATDRAAAFKAAGFVPKGNEYVRCDDTVTLSREPGHLEAADLNGDGRPEVFVKESSTYCYGNTAEAFVLVGKQANGTWKVMLDAVGIAVVNETRHSGWPDIEVGGPGFGPFPVYRFDGTTYVQGR